MFKSFRVAVVIPCYRVEATVTDVVAKIPEFVDWIIAVNDASPDGTQAVLQSIPDPRMVLLKHETNQGVGGAMATGYEEALRRDADIVVKLDGDGQMDPPFMRHLVEPIAEEICDYAKGNRFLHFQALKKMPWSRKIGNISLTFLTKLASGYWHTFDPQNGYLAIRTDYLRALDLDRLRSRRYFFENEMLIRLNVESARVLDCPMPSVYAGEVSSLRIGKVLTYFPYFLTRGFLSRLFHRYVLRDFSVVIPLYLFGGLSFLFGLMFGLFALVVRIAPQVIGTFGVSLRTRGTVLHELSAILPVDPNVPLPSATVMLSVLPLMLGVQFLLQGLLIDILSTPRVERPTWHYEK